MIEKLKSPKIPILLGALVSLVMGTVLLWLLIQIYQPYQGYKGSHQMISISPGYTVPQIGRTLESHGIVRSSTIFKWYVRLVHPPVSLKAGEYRFEGAVNLRTVVEKLRQGLVHYHRITVPEGLTMDQIAERFALQGLGTVEEFSQALQGSALIADLDPLAENLEGYLFPDTYFVTRDLSEDEIVRAMVNNFRRAWTPQRLKRAHELDLTTREVITLGSLIEKETGIPGERPLISAVFHNRLRKNLKLECDPTVIYAVKLVKEYDGVINQSDLNLDSPYNTYLYPGLPPGPIASPGLESIDAALQPAEVNYLYFVAKNDGGHFFSTHYREHRRAVEQYRR
ncbi:endolytic transglycosylase MltG [Acidobacteria bacterium AH-259-L09]|nr:endolytic transglycosylase MltG [Acidobacteria bacterium AH-259-L09]